MNPKVDAYLSRATVWKQELTKLVTILRGCGLTEELKWGKPCYSYEGGNVVLTVPFKETCALILPKGALLKDPKGIVIQPTENSQSMRQIRFTSLQQIVEMEATVKAYIREAIEIEKSGVEITYKKTSDFAVPEEFAAKLTELPKLKAAFESLTPGRQRAYLLYFAGAKQSKTRASRVEKCIPQILKGKGLDD